MDAQKKARIMMVGVPASPGYAMGHVYPMKMRDVAITEELVPESKVKSEENLFRQAIKRTAGEISQIKELSEKRAGTADSLIFETHLMILKDPGLVEAISSLIVNEHRTARFAIHSVMQAYIEKFEKFDSPMKERAADLKDLHSRLLQAVDDTTVSAEDFASMDDAVLVAHEIVPSLLMSAKEGCIKALVMDTGGRTSHVAILARSLQIPVVSGLRNMTSLVKEGDDILVDGTLGTVIVNPDDNDIRKFDERREVFEKQRRELFTMRRLEPMTRDGKYITLHANIELPSEAEKVTDYGASGVGLYRSEFLFLQGNVPTEKEQEDAYRTILESLAPAPVTIRTLDAGGDKLVQGISAADEANPFMGWRSIRVCLDREDIFTAQLRALLLSNTQGNLRILLPMISGVDELRRAKNCIERCRASLENEGHLCAKVKVGVMIEVPAAVMLVNILAKEADFFSIGTNDLIQFTLAVDRTNELITDMFEPHHPAILNMIYKTVEAAHREGIPIAVCGEMSADPISVLLLVGLGVDELSMTPWSVMATKKIIRSINFEDVRESALAVLGMDDANSVNEFMHRKYAQIIMDLGISSFVGRLEHKKDSNS